MNKGVSSMVIRPKAHTWNLYMTSPTG